MSVNELEAVGITRMDEADIDGSLTSQGVGIIGLPTETHPYLLSLSFGYDGQDLYFTSVTGEESRKAELSQRAETATFPVYDAPSRFAW